MLDLHLFLDPDPQPVLHAGLAQNALGRLPRCLRAAERPSPSGWPQAPQSPPRLVQLLPPGVAVSLFLLRTEIPEDAVAFLTTRRILKGMVDHLGLGLAARVFLAQDLRPADLVALHPDAEPLILAARPWHHRQEAAVVASDQGHVVLG